MKLFVGGLNFATDNDGLRRAFETFGELEDVAVISDRDTGRSRGFGFVTFREAADAKRAMAEMDNREIDGRTVRVNEAAERAPRTGGGGGGRSFGGGGGGGGRGGCGGGGGGGGGGGRGGRGGRGDRDDRW